jgi:multiple sugar transport system permease protein
VNPKWTNSSVRRGLHGLRANFRRYDIAYLLILPTLAYLAVFQLYPLFESIRLSFTDLSFIKPRSGGFVGFQNYRQLLFDDPNFWRIVGNTFVWVIASTFFQYLLAIPAAVILNQKLRLRSLWRGLMMIPWVTPVVIMGLIWKWIYDGDYGLLNYYLNLDVVWLGNSLTVWPAILLASIWKGLPYATIMVLAGLQGVPETLLEAAYIDGCSKTKAFFKVTIPSIMPILAVSTMISTVLTWTKFEMIWVLTAGGPGYTTSILPTYIYTKAFRNFEIGSGSAVAVISMVAMLIFVIAYFAVLKLVEDDQ